MGFVFVCVLPTCLHSVGSCVGFNNNTRRLQVLQKAGADCLLLLVLMCDTGGVSAVVCLVGR